MDHSPPGSSVHEILQARMLEWGAMPSSRASSWLRDRIRISYVSCTGRAGSLPLVPARHIHLCKCTYCVCVFYVEKVAWQGGGAWEEERKRRDKQEHPQSCMDSACAWAGGSLLCNWVSRSVSSLCHHCLYGFSLHFVHGPEKTLPMESCSPGTSIHWGESLWSSQYPACKILCNFPVF